MPSRPTIPTVRRLIASAALLSACHVSEAADAFGLDFGEHLRGKPCAVSRVYTVPGWSKQLFTYESPRSGSCLAPAVDVREGGPLPPRTEWTSAKMLFAPHDKPAIAEGNSASLSLSQGRLTRVHIATRGITSQAQVMKALTDKYGAPTEQRPVQVTDLGRRVKAVEATWVQDGIEVWFRSAFISQGNRAMTGLVIIGTPTAMSEQRAEEATTRSRPASL